ncbi:Ig-like domain-containing protein, partial [Candidatus Woesearchaeota archaeon]|nr:Ig-like domain-containing protein [Candidatus Woesearchaeota archaeon]
MDAHGCNETNDGCLAWVEFGCQDDNCNEYAACRITCRGEVKDYTKANYGELSTIDFGFYLSENRCKKIGDCACGQLPENIAEQKDPDDSSGACACIQGTEWNSGGKCCGDDKTDCGKISTGILCSIDENLASSQWLSSSSNLGDIRYVGCSDTEFLSDGKNWIKCDGAFWQKTIGKSTDANGYICMGKGRESIAECCGDSSGSCKSKVDGKTLLTGQSVLSENFENQAITGGAMGLDKMTGRVISPSQSLSLMPSSVVIGIGGDLEFAPFYYPDGSGSGKLLNSTLVNWSSNNPIISSVYGGEVTGNKTGTATITARYQGLVANAQVKITGTFYNSSISIGEKTHTFGLYIPQSYDPDIPSPLVIVLHGGGTSGDAMEELTLGGLTTL